MTNPVLQAIESVSSDPRIVEAELLGARLESGWNANAVGDNGTSFGPFQIHTPVHPDITPAQAEDPATAAAYIEPAYAAGVASVPASLWSSNPEQAAEMAAFAAERPAQDYFATAGASGVGAAWQAVTAALSGQNVGSVSGFSPLGGTATGQDSESFLRSLLPGGGLDTPGKILQGSGVSISGLETDIFQGVLTLLAAGAGVALVVIGLTRATGVHPSPALAAAVL